MTTKKQTAPAKRPRLGGFGDPIPAPRREEFSEAERVEWLSRTTEIVRQQLLAKVSPEEGEEIHLLTVAVVNGRIHMATVAPVLYVKEMNLFVAKQIRRAELEAELAALDGL